MAGGLLVGATPRKRAGPRSSPAAPRRAGRLCPKRPEHRAGTLGMRGGRCGSDTRGGTSRPPSGARSRSAPSCPRTATTAPSLELKDPGAPSSRSSRSPQSPTICRCSGLNSWLGGRLCCARPGPGARALAMLPYPARWQKPSLDPARCLPGAPVTAVPALAPEASHPAGTWFRHSRCGCRPTGRPVWRVYRRGWPPGSPDSTSACTPIPICRSVGGLSVVILDPVPATTPGTLERGSLHYTEAGPWG